MRRGIVSSLVGIAVLATSPSLRAEPRPEPTHAVRLVYARERGAERCPDEAALRDAVVLRLGYDPFQASAARRVTVSVGRRGVGLHAEVRLDDAQGGRAGSRRIDAAPDECDELMAATALAIAIAIDPESQLRPAPAAPPPAVPVASGPVEAPPAAPRAVPPLPWIEPLPVLVAPPAPAAADEPIHVRAGLAALVAAGSAPHVTAGVALSGGVRWRALSAVLEARADLPASKDATPSGTVTAQRFVFTLAPCFHRSWLVACALGSVGALRGVGSGLPVPKTGVTAFGTGGVRLGAEVPIRDGISLALAADLVAEPGRTSLQLRGQDVWTTPLAEGTLRIGIVADFP